MKKLYQNVRNAFIGLLSLAAASTTALAERTPEYMQTYSQESLVLNPATSLKTPKRKLQASSIKGNLNRYSPTNDISSYVKSEANVSSETSASAGVGLKFNNYYLSGAADLEENTGATFRLGRNSDSLDVQAAADYLTSDELDQAYQIVLSLRHKPESMNWLNETASLHLGDVTGIEAELAARLYERAFGNNSIKLEALLGGFGLQTENNDANGAYAGARATYNTKKFWDAFIQARAFTTDKLLGESYQVSAGLNLKFGKGKYVGNNEINYLTLASLAAGILKPIAEEVIVEPTPIVNTVKPKPDNNDEPEQPENPEEPEEPTHTGDDETGGLDGTTPVETGISGGDEQGGFDGQ